MGEQATGRMATAAPEGGTVAAKSGALFGRVRNEIGLPETGEDRYAFAVFTSGDEPFRRISEINAAMAAAVRIAIEELSS